MSSEFFENLKSFISYYRGHMPLFILDMSAGVLNSALTVLMPLVVYRVLDDYLPNHNMPYILGGALLLLIIALLITGAEYVGIRWGHVLGARMESDMRDDLFRYLQKLSFSYFDRTRTGSLMSRMTNDLNLITETAHHAPEDLLISILTFLGAFVGMFWINPLLAAITLIPLPGIVIWGSIFQRRMHSGFREMRKQVAEINNQVENSIQGIREVKSYNNEADQEARFSKVNLSFQKARESVCATMANFHGGITFLIQSYTLLFVMAGVVLTYWDMATLPEVMAFMMYSRFIVMPIFRMVNFAEQTQQTAAAFERFREVMRERPEIVDAPDAIDVPRLAGKIEFEHVSFKYSGMSEEEPEVLKDLSFVIPAGRTVALVGESGAGKSTLASLLPRFYEASAGRVLLDGVDVRKLKQRFLRSQVGIVQQTPFLFDSTIRENILLGNPAATEAEVLEAARNANIMEFIERLPDRFDSEVGERGVRLSGGQRQRISLARVFLKNPAVLIFDEATSSLDNESEALVQEALERLCKKRTTLIIAHRLSTVKNADYIYCLRDGRIVEEGTHNELLARNGYYHELYTMHSF